MEFIDLKAFIESNMPESYGIPKIQKYNLTTAKTSRNYYISSSLKKYDLNYK